MQQNNHAQGDTVTDEAVRHGFEDIQKIAGAILDARDILERKSTGDARALYDKMAEFIYELSTRGVVPKTDGTTLERRMSQLVSLATEFSDVFDLSRTTLKTHEKALVNAVIGVYRLGQHSSARAPQIANQQKSIFQAYSYPGYASSYGHLIHPGIEQRNKRTIDEMRIGSDHLITLAPQEENGSASKKLCSGYDSSGIGATTGVLGNSWGAFWNATQLPYSLSASIPKARTG